MATTRRPRTTTADRRPAIRRVADLQRRVTEVEELARANRRELELQFRRMADMQAEIDMLRKR
jgi:phage host-nuclease inhibitor protein Gam